MQKNASYKGKKLQTNAKNPNTAKNAKWPKMQNKKKMFAYFPSPVYFPSPICTGQGLSGVPYRTRPGARQPVSPVLGQGYIKSNRGRAFFFGPSRFSAEVDFFALHCLSEVYVLCFACRPPLKELVRRRNFFSQLVVLPRNTWH